MSHQRIAELFFAQPTVAAAQQAFSDENHELVQIFKTKKLPMVVSCKNDKSRKTKLRSSKSLTAFDILYNKSKLSFQDCQRMELRDMLLHIYTDQVQPCLSAVGRFAVYLDKLQAAAKDASDSSWNIERCLGVEMEVEEDGLDAVEEDEFEVVLTTLKTGGVLRGDLAELTVVYLLDRYDALYHKTKLTDTFAARYKQKFGVDQPAEKLSKYLMTFDEVVKKGVTSRMDKKDVEKHMDTLQGLLEQPSKRQRIEQANVELQEAQREYDEARQEYEEARREVAAVVVDGDVSDATRVLVQGLCDDVKRLREDVKVLHGRLDDVLKENTEMKACLMVLQRTAESNTDVLLQQRLGMLLDEFHSWKEQQQSKAQVTLVPERESLRSSLLRMTNNGVAPLSSLSHLTSVREKVVVARDVNHLEQNVLKRKVAA
jgi:hypothetical protein